MKLELRVHSTERPVVQWYDEPTTSLRAELHIWRAVLGVGVNKDADGRLYPFLMVSEVQGEVREGEYIPGTKWLVRSVEISERNGYTYVLQRIK